MSDQKDKQARNVGFGVLIFALVFVALIAFFYWRSKNSTSNSQTDNNATQTQSTATSLDSGWNNDQKLGLAKALADKGAIFYGAYWCSHCKEQKGSFGEEAMKSVTYYECDAQGPNPKVNECNAAGIAGYPTWIYKGEKKEGAQSLDVLAAWIGYTK